MIQSTKVMVTGATGYVAGHLIKNLLEAGHTVHAAVRDPKNKAKLKFLNQIADKTPGSIMYFKSDLLQNDSYFEAMQGCSVVFHTASPFVLEVKDPQKDLVEPALLGTQNVLKSVNNTDSVKRVVLTSSCAAIYGDNIDLEKTSSGEFTEEHWNESSSLAHSPYSYSKTLAEREAWKINKNQSRWDLVVVNPSLVMGPGINPTSTSGSFAIIKQMGDGTMKAGVPNWGMGLVDVRDLATAHYNAGFFKEASGRYIISGTNTSFPEIAQSLVPKFGNKFPIPRKTLPKAIVWALAPFVNKLMTRKAIQRNVNYKWVGNNSKSIRELKLSYRPLNSTTNEYFQQLVDNNLI